LSASPPGQPSDSLLVLASASGRELYADSFHPSTDEG